MPHHILRDDHLVIDDPIVDLKPVPDEAGQDVGRARHGLDRWALAGCFDARER